MQPDSMCLLSVGLSQAGAFWTFGKATLRSTEPFQAPRTACARGRVRVLLLLLLAAPFHWLRQSRVHLALLGTGSPWSDGLKPVCTEAKSSACCRCGAPQHPGPARLARTTACCTAQNQLLSELLGHAELSGWFRRTGNVACGTYVVSVRCVMLSTCAYRLIVYCYNMLACGDMCAQHANTAKRTATL